MSKDIPILFNPAMVRALIAGDKNQTRRGIRPANSLLDGESWPKWAKGAPDVFDWANARVGQGSGPYLELHTDESEHRISPRAAVGDRFWVKENWRVGAWDEDNGKIAVDYRADNYSDPTWRQCNDPERFERIWIKSSEEAQEAGVYPDVDGQYSWQPGNSPCRWRSSLLMPRFASRILREIVGIRIERVGAISNLDARGEGITECIVTMEDVACRRWSHDWSLDEAESRLTPRLAFEPLWNSINAAPKPTKVKGGVINYISYPFEDRLETTTYHGKPWYILGNSHVFVYDLKVVS